MFYRPTPGLIAWGLGNDAHAKLTFEYEARPESTVTDQDKNLLMFLYRKQFSFTEILETVLV